MRKGEIMVSLNLLKYVLKGGKAAKSVSTAAPNLSRASRVNIHFQPGEILRMAKPGKIKIESVPTQKKINEMLQVGKYDGVEGIYDRKKCADALYAFTKGTPIEHVKTESVKTLDAINNMHRIKFVDKMKMAEATGNLPQDVLARRKEIVEAFDTGTVTPRWKVLLDKKFTKSNKITATDVSKTSPLKIKEDLQFKEVFPTKIIKDFKLSDEFEKLKLFS